MLNEFEDRVPDPPRRPMTSRTRDIILGIAIVLAAIVIVWVG